MFYKRPYPLNNKTQDVILKKIEKNQTKEISKECNINFQNFKESKNMKKKDTNCILYENINQDNANKIGRKLEDENNIQFQQNLKIISNNISFSTKKN